MKKGLFSSADCESKQQDLGLSNSQTNILFRDIRLAYGSKKIIEKNAFIMIQEKNLQLNTFFELSKLVYCLEEKETKIIKNMEFPTILCLDLPGLINKAIEKHQRERGSVLIKIKLIVVVDSYRFAIDRLEALSPPSSCAKFINAFK